MAFTVPGFIHKPMLAVWGKKWYILGAFSLLVLGGLAAFITQDHAATSSKATPKVSSTSTERRKDQTTDVAGAETTNEDEPPADTTAPKPTVAPTQQAQPSIASGPTGSDACINNPPQGFELKSDMSTVSLKVGESSQTLEVHTSDGSKVLWSAAGPVPVDPSGVASQEVVLFVKDSATGYASTNFTYEVHTTDKAVPGTYRVTLTAEDGSRTICQTQTMTIYIEENI